MTTIFETQAVRFAREVVPFEIAIRKAWIDICPHGLLPSVAKDYAAIQEIAFDDKLPPANREQLLYIGTAGSPCSGKSTELDLELAKIYADYRYSNLVIIDPDRYTMDLMNYTYRPLLTAGKKAELGTEEAARQAYNTARPGSNIIANLNFNKAFNDGYHIAHGTTMTSPFIGSMLNTLGERGYYRRLLLCSAPDEMRIAAGEKRIGKEAHYQVDPSDFVEKGLLYPARMADYFTHGDHLKLLWKPELEQKAVLAAEYKDGQKIIHNPAAFDAFQANYESGRQKHLERGTTLPEWSAIEPIYLGRDFTKEAQITSTPPSSLRP